MKKNREVTRKTYNIQFFSFFCLPKLKGKLYIYINNITCWCQYQCLYTVPKVTKIPKAKRKKEEDDEKL